MTEFNSKWQIIEANQQSVFNFLKDLRNFEKLMPEQVINYQASGNRCSFTIKGMTSLNLIIDEAREHQLIRLIPEGKAAFEFELVAHIKAADARSEVKISLDAKLNPMMAMMAKRPLQNLIEIMVDKLSQQKIQ